MELKPVLRDNLEGWDIGGGREVQEGGDICLIHVDIGRTNKILKSSYLSIKNK